MRLRTFILIALVPALAFLASQGAIAVRGDGGSDDEETLRQTSWLQPVGRVFFPLLTRVQTSELTGGCAPRGGRITVAQSCRLDVAGSEERLRALLLVPPPETVAAATLIYEPAGDVEPTRRRIEAGESIRLVALQDGGVIRIECSERCPVTLALDDA